MDANAGADLARIAGYQLKKSTGGRLLFSEPTAPCIEKVPLDVAFPAIGGDAHAARRLLVHGGEIYPKVVDRSKIEGVSYQR